MRLAGCTSLVTGSNRGIGAGIAVSLAQDGADVAINYLEGDEEAEAVAERIRVMGRRALLVRADLRDPAAIEQMMQTVATQGATIKRNLAAERERIASTRLRINEFERLLTKVAGPRFEPGPQEPSAFQI